MFNRIRCKLISTMSYCHMSVHSTQSRSCARYNCPNNTGAVCDNLLSCLPNSDKFRSIRDFGALSPV